MTPEQHFEFPTGSLFLKKLQKAADEASNEADMFADSFGEKLPLTTECLGTVLSYLYRMACCAWGCPGGDHQVEWLLGRVVNQAVSSHRLVRAGQYDESLMLIRGIGEAANLLVLFSKDEAELSSWKNAALTTRLSRFSPQKVRNRLKSQGGNPLIDDIRYWKLCEIGTHPVPGVAPNHYSGNGRPTLGIIPQPAGVMVCMTELGIAVASAALPCVGLVPVDKPVKQALFDNCARLVNSLGTFTILNYEDLLKEVIDKSEDDKLH